MGRLYRFKTVLVPFVLCIIGFTDCSHAPVFMWNIDMDIAVNPLQTMETSHFVDQLTKTADNKLIVVFIQDELSVEDFKSDSLTSLKSLAELSVSGSVYVPSVANPETMPGLLESKGYKLVKVKSHHDLPTETLNEQIVLVVELPSTWSEDARRENLELNANVIAQVYEVLKSQQSDVIGIFTAQKNTKGQESRIRIARAVSKEAIGDNGSLFNVSGKGYLFFEKAPLLKYIRSGVNWNFTLSNLPTGSEESTVDVEKREAKFVLIYENIQGNQEPNVVLNRAEISMEFGEKMGYWVMNKASLQMEIDDKGTKVSVEKEMIPGNVMSPLSFSFHCTPKMNLISFGLGNSTGSTEVISLEMDGYQLQPFGLDVWGRFGDWYDCQGFFTEGVWAGILLGLVIAMMLAWAVGMLADVRTPDRFDDPKGKTITITATD